MRFQFTRRFEQSFKKAHKKGKDIGKLEHTSWTASSRASRFRRAVATTYLKATSRAYGNAMSSRTGCCCISRTQTGSSLWTPGHMPTCFASVASSPLRHVHLRSNNLGYLPFSQRIRASCFTPRRMPVDLTPFPQPCPKNRTDPGASEKSDRLSLYLPVL